MKKTPERNNAVYTAYRRRHPRDARGDRCDRLDDLFDEIPNELLIDSLHGVPTALTEMEITR